MPKGYRKDGSKLGFQLGHPSWKKGRGIKKISHCIDCGRENNWQSKRCMSCSQKNRLKNPKNHPNYKDGKSLRLNVCCDCGIKIVYQAKRCISCAMKFLFKNPKNNPQWKGGKDSYLSRIANAVYREHNISIICEECATTEDICIHHRDENRKNNNIDNLQALCRGCHTKHHFQKAIEYVKQTH